MRPRIDLYPGFTLEARNIHFGDTAGECLDFPREDLFFFDLDGVPQLGEIALLRNRDTGVWIMKYFFEYNGRRIWVSRHPPIPDHPGLEVAGRLMLRYSPGLEDRRAPDEQEASRIQRSWSSAIARGYGSPAWFLQVLGPWPPRSARTTAADVRGVHPVSDVDRKYGLNRHPAAGARR